MITADLRGFTITEEALTSLVSNNGQLREITLPGGCSRDQLQPLRRLTELRAYDVRGPYRRHHGVSAGESTAIWTLPVSDCGGT